MRKLTNPWSFQKDPARRAEYAAGARERLAEIATRPIAAVFVRSTESYRYYRVLGITDQGRHTAIASDIAGAAYNGKRVETLHGDIVEGQQGWLVRVNSDGVDGYRHIAWMLSAILGTDCNVTEF